MKQNQHEWHVFRHAKWSCINNANYQKKPIAIPLEHQPQGLPITRKWGYMLGGQNLWREWSPNSEQQNLPSGHYHLLEQDQLLKKTRQQNLRFCSHQMSCHQFRQQLLVWTYCTFSISSPSIQPQNSSTLPNSSTKDTLFSSKSRW